MARVSIDQLTSDMVLSDNVRGINSKLLLTKGVRIEAKHIRILKMWGVCEVDVEGADPAVEEAQAPLNAEQFDLAGRDIIRLFSNLDMGHPAIKEIVKLSIPYRMAGTTNKLDTGYPKWNTPIPDAMPAKDLLARIERIDVKLPEVPSLVFELNEIMADPLSSSADIARLVNQSPSLAAMLLKIVNSAFYGFRSRVDSISRAVVMIGSKEISNLALGITIMETFRDIPRQVLDVESFQEHNLACGIVARILAAHGNIAGTEQLFVSGMLHDIGRLVLCKYFPQVTRAIIAQARQSGHSLMQIERNVTGCTHAQIGKKLIQKWKLPYALENNVHYHHNPSASPNPESAAIVQVADIIVHGLGIGGSVEHLVPGFDGETWDRLKIPVGALPSILHQALHQIQNFRSVFIGDPGDGH